MPERAFEGSGTVIVGLRVTGVDFEPTKISIQPPGENEASLVVTDPPATDLMAPPPT
ncbi:hypothetical protein [Paraliomyxa miuraensis]|uniref:hypothetical protein n=1 Tax=Paraliomyxa miuraensis TaxID=376150 RepID=UPI00225C1DE1|nr:hypothetical protein [Paraliomyxa miuraensis]MCX4240592.1 hypothetical protein [Paraliomyxa miuraensis]